MAAGDDEVTYTWIENTERRIGILEQKIDKLLDPELGIYAKLASLNARLSGWAIAILTTIIASLIVQIVTGR